MGKRDDFGTLVPRENRDGRVTVPRNYQSDQPPVLHLRSLSAKVKTDWDRPTYGEDRGPMRTRDDAPLRISLELDGNAEAVKRLAQLFGLYGSADEWNRMAKAHGLPTVPEGPLLPAASAEETPLSPAASSYRPKQLPASALPRPDCARCGHAYHDGWCPSCEDDSSCMGSEFVEEP